MKKKFIAILSATLAVSALATTLVVSALSNSKPYNYPVTPDDTEEWSALGGYQERVAACQIPENTLEDMSTDALAQTVVNYPFIGNILAFNTTEAGYASLVMSFNGLAELEKRDGAAKALTKVRDKLDDGKYIEITFCDYAIEHLS